MQLKPLPLLLASAFLPALAQADTPASAQAAQATLPALSVTAKGYAASDLATPIATVTLDQAQLQQRAAANPGEALRGEAGISVASDGPQGQNPVIRGLKKESVVLLLDGMRLNSAQPAGAVASFLSPGLAERMEVVKGPASVLYGSGALGGVLNVRLPQAKFTPGLSGRWQLSGESAADSLRGSGVINYSAADHALMLGAASARHGDYRAPDGKIDHTGYQSDSLIAQYRYRLDPRRQLRISAQEHQDRDVWYPGSKKPHPAKPAVVGNLMVHAPKQTRRLYELGYEQRGEGEQPLNFDLRVYRQEAERNIWSYADRLKRDIARTQVNFVTDGLDARADWLAHANHLLSFGVNSWRMEASPDRRLAAPTPMSPLVPNAPFADGRLEASGIFVQDDMNFGRLNILAGLRHDRVKGNAASINNGAVTTGLARSDSTNSASLAALYEITPLLRPYVSVARAFRAGEMRERFEASPRGDGYHYLGNPQIRPETAVQGELGLKGEASNFSYSLALYRNRIQDYITGQPTGATLNGLPVKQTVNLGKAVLRGIDAQAHWQFLPKHTASLSYSQVRGDNRDLNEPLFQMPADELNLGWTGALLPQWSFDANLRLVRKQTRVASRFALGSEDATAGHGLVDVGATWQYTQRQSLRVVLKNVGDKAYHDHLTEGLSGQEIGMPGRSLSLTWQGEF